MRDLHRHHRVDPSYRPFDVRGVAAAIRNEGSSTAQGPDGVTVLQLRHLGKHGLAFLTELFNFSVSKFDIPAIWKNSVIIPTLKVGKPRDQGLFYRPISLLCPAVKLLERLLFLSFVKALGAHRSQHSFRLRLSTASALLPISARVVSGFNQRTAPSRTIAIAVDISKLFETVSHCFLVEMIHRSRFRHNWVRWLVAYLRGRRPLASIGSTTSLPARCGRGSGRDSSSPQPFSNTFCRTALFPTQTWRPMLTTPRCWPLLPESWTKQLCSYLVRWADDKQLAIAPQKSSVTLFTSDILQSRLHPQVWVGDAAAPMNRTPKILGVTLGTLFTFGPHARDCVERALRALNVMKALTGSNWGFTTETLVAAYKAIVRPILNYSSHLVHSSVFLRSEQTWGDPEQGSEDRDRLLSKGRGVLPQSRDWGPPPEATLRTVLSAVLCQRPPTPIPQSPIRHFLSRPRPLKAHTTAFLEACE